VRSFFWAYFQARLGRFAPRERGWLPAWPFDL
jgi:hypothetical protein